jgi:hypothetical protein
MKYFHPGKRYRTDSNPFCLDPNQCCGSESEIIPGFWPNLKKRSDSDPISL